MRIIKLGHLNMEFVCEVCGTQYETTTDEIERNICTDTYTEYFTECPLCKCRKFLGNDNTLVDFLKQRDKLEKEKQDE